MTTLNPGLTRRWTDSGVAATRFSNGKFSFGIPIVKSEYAIPFGVTLGSVEKALHGGALKIDDCCDERRLKDRAERINDDAVLLMMCQLTTLFPSKTQEVKFFSYLCQLNERTAREWWTRDEPTCLVPLILKIISRRLIQINLNKKGI
mmetsp:Transcript_10940/g.12527  ORF Transcript_10940/g.12527 Transcript_10940/m.12527 type:complete len:148 (-) Transcript_10940:1-444(-)